MLQREGWKQLRYGRCHQSLEKVSGLKSLVQYLFLCCLLFIYYMEDPVLLDRAENEKGASDLGEQLRDVC